MAKALDIERDTAYDLIRALSKLDLAEDRGVRRPESGRGRGENVYSFPDDLPAQVSRLLKKVGKAGT